MGPDGGGPGGIGTSGGPLSPGLRLEVNRVENDAPGVVPLLPKTSHGVDPNVRLLEVTPHHRGMWTSIGEHRAQGCRWRTLDEISIGLRYPSGTPACSGPISHAASVATTDRAQGDESGRQAPDDRCDEDRNRNLRRIRAGHHHRGSDTGQCDGKPEDRN